MTSEASAAPTSYVVSPAEPSGASWLVNCLLELGILVGHGPCAETVWRGNRPEPRDVWRKVDGRHVLHPRAELLKKWLPVCSRRETFDFRSDVAVDYVQDFPAARHREHRVLYVIRDPRDAIYSQYRRSSPSARCGEWVAFPNPATLLDRVDHWALHVRAWEQHPNVSFLRFEDYKRDARAALQTGLDGLGIEADEGAVAAAVEESSFEKARRNEERYRADHPTDREVFARSGRVGDWRDAQEFEEIAAAMSRRIGDVIERFDYTPSPPPTSPWALPAISRHLAFYRTIESIDQLPGAAPTDDDRVAAMLAFAARVDQRVLDGSGWTRFEIATLLDSLGELSRSSSSSGAQHAEVEARVQELRAAYSAGSNAFFDGVRALRKARKASATDRGGST